MIYVLVLLFLFLAVVFLMGKGDKLIAGYNTAPEEERKKFNIRRLRILMAIVCFITAAFCGLLPIIGEDITMGIVSTIVFIVITFIIVILANTWAKNK